jgi:putative transposase
VGRVARKLTVIMGQRFVANMITSDNGAELRNMATPRWLKARCVEWHDVAIGKRTQNVFVSRYNRKLSNELMNEASLTSLAHARAGLAKSRHDYNTVRTHSKLHYKTLVKI